MRPLPDQREVEAAIAAAIAHEAPLLRAGAANPIALLRAICQQESSGGVRWGAPLHESSFCYGGPYYKGDGAGGRTGDDELRRLSQKWGCFAHMSYGPWQVLYITAYEHGFRDHPTVLCEPKESAPYAVKMLNERCAPIVSPLPEDFFDAYNTGKPRDGRVNPKYVAEAMQHYRAFMGDLDA
jgi:hypothetical protein